MANKYIDLLKQTFDFPQQSFEVQNNQLYFHGIPLKDLVNEFGTPLRLTYLPKISEQIQKAKSWFKESMQKINYNANYYYCYCTKSSHFSFVVEEALKNDIHLETSSAYDMDLIKRLYERKKINKNVSVVCNGFKTQDYVNNISSLINDGFKNIYPILDNKEEIDAYKQLINKPIAIGIRIATDEEPNHEFYTSRLGIRYNEIIDFYEHKIKPDSKFTLKMLHFFINTGIWDSSYYWNELNKAVELYCKLKKDCPALNSLNIGGGFPIPHSLTFEYDYKYMIDEILIKIKQGCDDNGVSVPDIYTEFGTYTVGESGAIIYSIVTQKQQNDAEYWYMIDDSFITSLPDCWGIEQRFIMLPINRFNEPYKKVNIGGLTCDSMDYYNSEVHANQVFLPSIGGKNNEPLYIGFFHTGAYQEALSGYGGTKHCLIPSPKHIVINKNEKGELTKMLFAPKQTPDEMLRVLGY